MKISIAPTCLLVILTAACGSPAPTATEEPAQPTKAATGTPAPTHTPVPTATLAPSATPENQIFRDDFQGGLAPGWEWENEKPARWGISTDGWLSIVGEDAALLGGQQQSNLLWRDLPDGEFAITVHLQAKPMENFQQATIYLYEDLQNYVAINRGFCSPCRPGGNGVYMEYKIGSAFGTYAVKVLETDLYLRLESRADSISGFYATAPDEWQRVGRFGNYFGFQRVGLGVSNCDSGKYEADLAGLFDFFEITRP